MRGLSERTRKKQHLRFVVLTTLILATILAVIAIAIPDPDSGQSQESEEFAQGAEEREGDRTEGIPDFTGFEEGAQPAAEEEEEPEEEGPPTVFELLGQPIDLEDAELDEERDRLVVALDNGGEAVLTLHPQLQSHMTSVVDRYDEPAQALVAIEPVSGRVLAWVEARNDDSPAYHPAHSALPWAASVFKVITATLLLENGGVDPEEEMCVSPSRQEVALEDLNTDPDRDSRCVDMTSAMARSVNAYFARNMDNHGSTALMERWLERFGFNELIPFELKVEVSRGIVPDDRLERARMAAGFRHAHLSPLHGALIAATIANGGRMMQPYIVEQIEDGEGTVVYTHQPAVWREVMSGATAVQMVQVMSETTTSGTARRDFAGRSGWPDELEVAGKTGTLSNRSEQDPTPDPYLIYSWFVGFAPINNPNIAVAGLVYNTERWYIKGSYLASEAIVRYQTYLSQE